MTTGSFENWSGEIADIGAIYPFEGTETLMWIVGLVLWVAWHYIQLVAENKQLAEQEAFLTDEVLRKRVEKEEIGNV